MSELQSTHSNYKAIPIFSYCRFCASRMDQQELLDLTLDVLFGKYIKMLEILKLDVDLSDDKLPKRVCLQCHNKCLEYFNFYLIVKRSQRTLNILYNDSKSDIIKFTGEKEIKSEIVGEDKSLNNTEFVSTDVTEEQCESEKVINNTNFNQNPEIIENCDHEIQENLENYMISSKNEVQNEDSSFPDDNNIESTQFETGDINLRSSSDDVNLINSYCGKFRCNSEEKKSSFCDNFENNVELSINCNEDTSNVSDVHESNDSILKYKSNHNLKLSPCKDNSLNAINIVGNINVAKNSNIESNSSKNIVHNPNDTNETVLTWKNVTNQSGINTYSWTNYPWSCEHCKQDLDSMEDVREHSKHAHSRCYGFVCADCDGDFNMFNTFVEHVRMHRENLRLFCQYCNKQFANKTDCHQHSLTHWSSPVCEFCGETIPDERAIASHRSSYRPKPLNSKTRRRTPKQVLSESDLTWTDYEWSCLDCFKVEPDAPSLRAHVRSAHGKCFAMRCTDCLTKAFSFNLLVRHARGHRPYLRYLCQYCDHRVSNPDDLQPHIDRHHATEHRCGGCGDHFETHDSLLQHMITYKTPLEKKSFRENITCNVCLKVCTSLTSLKQHLLQHKIKNNKYVCEICGKRYAYPSEYKLHLSRHTNAKSEVCKICNKRFASKNILKSHAKFHLKDKPYICDHCGMKFKAKSNLARHMYIHLGIKPYVCIICDKRFAWKNSLNAHSVQHTGQRPYKCELCDRTFTNVGNCNKHMKRKHGKSFCKSKDTDMGRLEIDRESGAVKMRLDAESTQWLSEVTGPKKKRRNKV